MRSERTTALALLLAGGVAVSSVAQEPRVYDRILAVVDGRPLLLSEVRLVERLRGLGREAALEEAIDERLMFEQAVRLPQTAPTPGESERAYAELAAGLGGAPDDPEALRELARRQATILKYIEFRFRPLVRAEQAMRAEPGSEPLEEVDFDASAALDARIEEWVAELQGDARIRYNPEQS